MRGLVASWNEIMMYEQNLHIGAADTWVGVGDIASLRSFGADVNVEGNQRHTTRPSHKVRNIIHSRNNEPALC